MSCMCMCVCMHRGNARATELVLPSALLLLCGEVLIVTIIIKNLPFLRISKRTHV